jgi:KaiC/GvpD/RAD55 family RecA-like ATPase
MIVELVGLNPIWTLFTVLGILTLFGKKKDDKKGDESAAGSPGPASLSQNDSAPPQTPSRVSIPSFAPTSPSPSNVSGSYQAARVWSPPAQGDEDSSLSRLLQSLLKDLPTDSSSVSEPSGSFSMQNNPEWVPPRATPASRPMTFAPGAKKGPDQDKPVPSPPPATVPSIPSPPQALVRSVKPPEPVEATPKPTFQPKIPSPSSEKPAQPSKEDTPKRPSAPKVSQDFDHIFELTQGSFDSPGLIVVNGSIGSGKTTLCSGLANSFLKQGNPCMFVSYDKAPSALRDSMKKLGIDPSEPESNYRLLLVDGYSSQSDSFSFEPYYIEKAFDFDSIQDALVKNSSMFIGEKTKIIFDSMDQVVANVGSKDFVKRLGETMDKLRDSSVTMVVTIDLSKAPKDVVKYLEDTAACVIDLDKDDSDPDGRELKVRKLNGSSSKIDAETFEIDSGKGLVFVK